MPLLWSWERSIATVCYKDFAPSGATGGRLFGQSQRDSKCRTLGLAGETGLGSRFLALRFLLRFRLFDFHPGRRTP